MCTCISGHWARVPANVSHLCPSALIYRFRGLRTSFIVQLSPSPVRYLQDTLKTPSLVSTMALSMQQLTLRSLNIHATHNSVLPPKSKYLRSEERHGAQCSDTESDSETDDMNVHCGQEYVYFALGTTYHQDLYPGRATRLVVSRPKKTVRKVPRKVCT
ncbi:hypothetical protein HYPSUDRAFT_615665 [Hypholoma sublateritium FD-334 SS-4]|uniref:Uncharacterized protein n=1 Tax=Hypholoma sublateritium (strain FD-334 SS-4) TaxID=945553 RepID=A0A0D2QAS1_HYPSF|nr:hypothetical protein HYPSUDRAFT_615665 [Hypholoma sublateritium FD-334 SS-4]